MSQRRFEPDPDSAFEHDRERFGRMAPRRETRTAPRGRSFPRTNPTLATLYLFAELLDGVESTSGDAGVWALLEEVRTLRGESRGKRSDGVTYAQMRTFLNNFLRERGLHG